MAAQNVFRLEILKELRLDPGTETTEVWAEIEVGSPALLYARDLRLKSIQQLQLTPDVNGNQPANFDLIATKQIMNKGRKGNAASIYVWDTSGTAHVSGSVYLNVLAMGE